MPTQVRIGPAEDNARARFHARQRIAIGNNAVRVSRSKERAVGRNPGSSTQVMVQSILSIAFAEAIVFYALFLVQ